MKDISINTEDIVFIILIGSLVINIVGNNYRRNNNYYVANKYYLSSLIITIIIYFYFLNRNYKAYKECSNENKRLFEIKLLGTSFLIAGALCLIYFQINDPTSNLTPAI